MERVDLLTMLVGLTLVFSLMSAYVSFDLKNQLNILDGKVSKIPVDKTAPSTGNTQTGGSVSPPAGNTVPPLAPRLNVSVDDDPFIGPVDAKVVVVEFSDFECPFCGAAMNTHQSLIAQFKARDPNWVAAVPKLKELANQGKIKLVYRDFPLSNIHPSAQKAAEASECADEQGKFWLMHDKIFENQNALLVSNLKQYAVDIALNATQFNECLDSGKYADEVEADLTEGLSYGVQGTPAFFINGKLVEGAQSFSVFEQIINQELASN